MGSEGGVEVGASRAAGSHVLLEKASSSLKLPVFLGIPSGCFEGIS
jgi:hypothetical protein